MLLRGRPRFRPLSTPLRPAVLRRPAGLLAGLRWQFGALAYGSILITLPQVWVGGSQASVEVAALVALAVLAASLLIGYLRSTSPWRADLLDSAAIVVVSFALPSPAAAYGVLYLIVWFRSLYGSKWQGLWRATFYTVTMITSWALWPHVTSQTSGEPLGQVLGGVPGLCLAVFITRQLLASTREREHVEARDEAVARMGSQLLGVTDVQLLRRITIETLEEIRLATPGLRVLAVVKDGPAFRVDEARGRFDRVPRTLPTASFSPPADNEAMVVSGDLAAGLSSMAGSACQWRCVPFPDPATQSWLILGARRARAGDALTAVRSVINLHSLALLHASSHEALAKQAQTDSLTGLPNRFAFQSALSTALDDDRSSVTTVLFVDLDGFKNVNDTLGHSAGDVLLQEVADRIRHAVRPGDLCARLGGDEFAVLLPDVGADLAGRPAERIVTALAEPFSIAEQVVHIGASVGVAEGDAETDAHAVLQHADIAMYAAKANGKGRSTVFDPALFRNDRLDFDAQLADAAKRDELVVHYQPIMSVPAGRCTAVEALVRWQHPLHGLLGPAEFIQDAERTGAIIGIGEFVLRRACSDAARWQADFGDQAPAIHVNVSARQLDFEGLVPTVRDCLAEFAISPESLVLEVTETALVSSATAVSRLRALSAHGVQIALDHFGTGYSGLSTLRELPVNIVKIDKSFVSDSALSRYDQLFTEAIVAMTQKLGLRTIAEGVERANHFDMLVYAGVEAAQGYLYLRPAPVEDFTKWLGAHAQRLVLPVQGSPAQPC